MNKLIKSISVFLVIFFSISSVNAATLTDRLKDGHKLRLGFGTAVPWAYAGDNGEALGFVNMIALTVLEEMGITEHETKVFEWSGLIPGINANRSDMITGGMYILKSRCANINFSDPIGVFGDAMLVPKGNPKELITMQMLSEQVLSL
jgi:polar amino acid transport system substrate-binding protein